MIRKLVVAAVLFSAGVVTGPLVLGTVAAQNLRPVSTKRLLTTDLGSWCDGKEVTVELNDVEPGTSGMHYHPAHSFTYVLEGSETYALDDEPTRIVSVGDVMHESPMERHKVENLSHVRLLVVRVIEKGKQATVRVP